MNFVEVIRRQLVYIVIEPVAVQEIAVRPPFQKRFLFRIVIGEVIYRDCRSKSFSSISGVLVPESVAVVFRMSHNEDLSPVP